MIIIIMLSSSSSSSISYYSVSHASATRPLFPTGLRPGQEGGSPNRTGRPPNLCINKKKYVLYSAHIYSAHIPGQLIFTPGGPAAFRK